MNEKLLHFIWKSRLYNKTDLKTTEGEKVEIIQPGIHNADAGADFQNAKIKIGKTLWAGNVEMHVNSKDWQSHGHERDAAYNNVILHVVNESGSFIAKRKTGEPIPTLELKNRINPATLARYEELSLRKSWIPCQRFFKDAGDFAVRGFMERLLVERLESKLEQINLLLKESGNDWENVMFQMLTRYMGASINKEPFFLLAKSLPVKIWAKYQSDAIQLEALLFGQAGFLQDKLDDEYPNQLRKEYLYLKRLHSLQPLQKHTFKFLRLRPSNFPTVRMAQLAAIMKKEVKLFAGIKDAKNVKTIHRFFEADVSDYWRTHYQFDKPSKKVNSHLGGAMKSILLINAVAPVLFAYGKYKDDETYCIRAVELLEKCEAEDNSIIKGWKKMDLKPANAYDSQAMLQLKNEYCDKFRCLECAVGAKILK